jgi:hypothetical protein
VPLQTGIGAEQEARRTPLMRFSKSVPADRSSTFCTVGARATALKVPVSVGQSVAVVAQVEGVLAALYLAIRSGSVAPKAGQRCPSRH